MAGQLKNLSNLFQNTRTRSILIVTIGLVILGIVVGFISLKKRTSTVAATETNIQGTPEIQSIPGGFEKAETEEYVKLQTQQNKQQAEKARETGTSAVPTIVSSAPVTGGWQGGNFSSLNQKQALPNNYLLRGAGLADAEGTPVYNTQGLMTGLAYGKGSDRVCVMNCTAMGTVGPDGLIRDAKGNVIGKVAASALGTPVYDANGRLIGYAGADGKVRDLKGNVVGSIGPDGVFKDNAGKTGKAALGTPVYDENGRLIGYAAPNGVVRGLNGNIIGKLGADGIVRDANGKPIGKAAAATTAGAAPAGAGAVGAGAGLAKGTPVYDSKGRLIGYAGADGTVRDASGKVIGNLAADGTLRDANGNVIGSVTTPEGKPTGVQPSLAGGAAAGALPPTTGLGGPSAIAPTEAEQLQALRQRQQQQLEQQQSQQNQQQLTSNMTTQQGLLFASWAASSTQQYVEGQKPKEETEKGGEKGAGLGGSVVSQTTSTSSSSSRTVPFLKAGTILFAVLNTSVNSDEPGPVMATLVGNRLKGGKLLGTLINQGQKVMLTFNVLTLPNVPSSISINAVAIDPATARTALSSDTDNHYLLRYGSMFAAAFMQGYGQAVQQSGAVVVSNGLNTVTNMPTLSPKGQALAALGTVGQAWGEAIRPLFNKPPTVQVYACTALGILILADVAPPQ